MNTQTTHSRPQIIERGTTSGIFSIYISTFPKVLPDYAKCIMNADYTTLVLPYKDNSDFTDKNQEFQQKRQV